MADIPCHTRADLIAEGMSRSAIDTALADGLLVRARRDRYLAASAPRCVIEAVRVGGRLTCLSLLQLDGVFVFENSRTHVHVDRGASRLRSTQAGRGRLEHRRTRHSQVHWMPLLRSTQATRTRVAAVDAVVHAILCQPARHAIATIDSALNKGLIHESDLTDIFAVLPRRFRVLRRLVDGRAQSGTETLVRLIVRALGADYDLQVKMTGIGFVDLVVDGWLVIECDSKEFHSSWEQQVKDRERDLALAARGYATLRLTAAQILYRPAEVMAALKGMLALRGPRRLH